MDSAGIPWYSTGTVNVTQGSSNVAGVGTNWVNAGLKVGDIFTIDKSRLYQITAVNSNTSLSLQEAYQGATGSSQVYFVIRNFAGTMQAQIAAQVSELVNKYESYIDTELKQITGPAGPTSFPYRGTWTTGRAYNGLDVVQYGNQLYMALYGHTSTSANAPGASGTAWTQLTFDAAFAATKAELAVIENVGAKNFFQNKATTNTSQGVTWTINNANGIITANGTAIEHSYCNINTNFILPHGQYILLCCPNGGGGGMYRCAISGRNNSGVVIWENNDFGDGVTFVFDERISYVSAYAQVYKGFTANNLTFSPMIINSAITDTTYVPFGFTNAELTRRIIALESKIV